MKYLRELFRFILGTTAEDFNTKQAEDLMKFLATQTASSDNYISDVKSTMDAKVVAMTVLAEAIAKDKVTLDELRGK